MAPIVREYRRAERGAVVGAEHRDHDEHRGQATHPHARRAQVEREHEQGEPTMQHGRGPVRGLDLATHRRDEPDRQHADRDRRAAPAPR